LFLSLNISKTHIYTHTHSKLKQMHISSPFAHTFHLKFNQTHTQSPKIEPNAYQVTSYTHISLKTQPNIYIHTPPTPPKLKQMNISSPFAHTFHLKLNQTHTHTQNWKATIEFTHTIDTPKILVHITTSGF